MEADMNHTIILHIFNARQTHLVPTCIALMNDVEQINSEYVLCNYNESYTANYQEISKTVGEYKIHRLESQGWMITFFFFKKLLKNADARFVIHGQIDYKLRRLLSSVLAWHAERFSWVCWGVPVGPRRSFVKKAALIWLYNSFQKINCLMDQDRITLKEEFNVKKPISVIPYAGYYDNVINAATNPERQKTFKILVGHRANPYLKHLEIFEKIAKFKQEDIEVISFLNYGITDSDYVTKVVEKGKDLFADKFTPILELMDRDTYDKVMSEIDLTIIYAQHQVALGALYRTILSKGGVFLNVDGVNYGWFKQLGLRVGTIDELDSLSFDDFKYFLSEDEKESNQKTLSTFLDRDALVKRWTSFLMLTAER